MLVIKGERLKAKYSIEFKIEMNEKWSICMAANRRNVPLWLIHELDLLPFPPKVSNLKASHRLSCCLTQVIVQTVQNGVKFEMFRYKVKYLYSIWILVYLWCVPFSFYCI